MPIQKNIYLIIALISLLFSCSTEKTKYKTLANGTPESCITCHTDMTGFSPYHNPNEIGCSACHLGNITTYNKDDAHKNMVKIPGNLATNHLTCSSSECHTTEHDRINKSLMTTNSGLVSIDKFAFGETSTIDTLYHIENIQNTAADKHLKNLCFKCHLGYEKKHYGDITEQSRGGGCLACHLNYTHNSSPDITDNIHPTLNLNIGNDKCFGCHSRSGRISTNYEGWFETLYTKEDIKNKSDFRLLDDGRVFAKAENDVHHKAELLCIDCHSSQEIMGDGNNYKYQHEAVKIQCSDCHRKEKHQTLSLTELNEISMLDYALRKYKHQTNRFISTAKDSIALVNTYFDEENNPFLIGKISQQKHSISQSCEKDNVHSNMSCSMCHTSWAPSCIGCHTSYDATKKLKNGKQGKWYELVGNFGKAQPVMGVQHEAEDFEIVPSIPGMIMTLDKSHFDGPKKGNEEEFFRLFAPIAAHTTTVEVRSCESCHNNSEALGYGKGRLIYQIDNGKGKWIFTPNFENSEFDNLPQDAWIGFLSENNNKRAYSAHENFYPLSLKQQQEVLQVGSCLHCHKEGDFRKRLTDNYNVMLDEKTEKCVLAF